jgi:hypothetical protein
MIALLVHHLSYIITVPIHILDMDSVRDYRDEIRIDNELRLLLSVNLNLVNSCLYELFDRNQLSRRLFKE